MSSRILPQILSGEGHLQDRFSGSSVLVEGSSEDLILLLQGFELGKRLLSVLYAKDQSQSNEEQKLRGQTQSATYLLAQRSSSAPSPWQIGTLPQDAPVQLKPGLRTRLGLEAKPDINTEKEDTKEGSTRDTHPVRCPSAEGFLPSVGGSPPQGG